MDWDGFGFGSGYLYTVAVHRSLHIILITIILHTASILQMVIKLGCWSLTLYN